MPDFFDVIIVGAGPAGATLAYELSRTGTSVLVIEKQTLPRYKCCAGGVTARTAKLLPIDISEVAEDIVNSAEVNYRGEHRFSGSSNKQLIYMVMRDKFDYALTKRAEEAGATILQGQMVTHIQENARGVEVHTPKEVFYSQFLVGADGVHSIVAREARLNGSISYVAGINAEVSANEQVRMRWQSRILVELGYICGGYAWVFPKGRSLSIGIACLSSHAKSLKHAYLKFLDSINISQSSIVKMNGGLLPVCRGEPKLFRNRIVLIGDAAGLVDPFTGEGIHNAVQSAILAAPVITDCLLHGTTKLEDYQHAVSKTIMPDMRIARLLRKIFVYFPEVVTRLLGVDARVWKGCCYMVLGELDYTTALQKAGGLKGISALLLRALTNVKRAYAKATIP